MFRGPDWRLSVLLWLSSKYYTKVSSLCVCVCVWDGKWKGKSPPPPTMRYIRVCSSVKVLTSGSQKMPNIMMSWWWHPVSRKWNENKAGKENLFEPQITNVTTYKTEVPPKLETFLTVPLLLWTEIFQETDISTPSAVLSNIYSHRTSPKISNNTHFFIEISIFMVKNMAFSWALYTTPVERSL